MAYRNNIYGNAAYSGFFSGMLQGRSIASSVQADYTAFRTAALAMAVNVDALIAFDALVTTAAAITQLSTSNALQAAIAGTTAVPGDGGQAIIDAVTALTTGNVIPANEQWRGMLLFSICQSVAAGRSTKSSSIAAGQTVQAAAIVAAWNVAIAGLVIP